MIEPSDCTDVQYVVDHAMNNMQFEEEKARLGLIERKNEHGD